MTRISSWAWRLFDDDYDGQRECTFVSVSLHGNREEKTRVLNVPWAVGGEGTLAVMEGCLAEVQLWMDSGVSLSDTVCYWCPVKSLTDVASWSGQIFMQHQLESI